MLSSDYTANILYHTIYSNTFAFEILTKFPKSLPDLLTKESGLIYWYVSILMYLLSHFFPQRLEWLLS